MKTTVIIDDKLMSDAMQVSGLRTKNKTIEYALKLMINVQIQPPIKKHQGKLKRQESGKT